MPSILYVLGAILLVFGGGILWLLFRRPKPAATDGYPPADYEPARAPTLGYPMPARHAASPPNAGAPLNPTTVMPAIRDGWTPPPGVDPWARGGSGADPTQEFPGRRP